MKPGRPVEESNSLSAANGAPAELTTRPKESASSVEGLEAEGTQRPLGASLPEERMYNFIHKGDGPFGRTNYKIELTVDVTQVQPGTYRVESRRESGYAIEEIVQTWNAAGIYGESKELTFRMTGETRSCQFQPPSPFARFPLQVGDSWEYEGKCGTSERGSQYKVIGTEVLTIGGREVSTFVILGEKSIGTSKSWFADSYGLVVRLDIAAGGTSFTEILERF